MPSVTIDAGVLAGPLEDRSAEDCHRYIDTLLDWRRLLEEPWVAIYMSGRASQTLVDDGLLPLRAQLQRLFTKNGIVEYDVNTVARVVDTLLQITPSFETYFSVRDVLAEELVTEPDILRLCSGTRLASDLARCIILIAILRSHCSEPIRDHSLILRRAPDRVVRVRALIHLLEHERSDLSPIPTPPERFEGDVLVCDDFSGLVECLEETTILLKATDDLGINTAIQLALYKTRQDHGQAPEWNDVPSYTLGYLFRDSIKKRHPTKGLASKLLRAVVETLEQTNLSATHELRISPSGNAPQRIRKSDGAGAWRRDVDDDHHLHYWSCKNNHIEFASLSFPHGDMAIPE